jgi:hypothetical protein
LPALQQQQRLLLLLRLLQLLQSVWLTVHRPVCLVLLLLWAPACVGCNLLLLLLVMSWALPVSLH